MSCDNRAWPVLGGVRVIKRGEVEGEGFGESTYTLYEACSPPQVDEVPYLYLWLHGADGGGDLPTDNIRTMQKRLRRRTYFLVPLSPKAAKDGRRFFWGVCYTKAQNKNDLGYIFGEFHEGYLAALTGVARQISNEVEACRVFVGGYSMGGFGAYQLGSYAPDLFDTVVSVAGYGLGTLEAEDGSYGAPQPQSAMIFNGYLQGHASRLAAVRLVVAVHAEKDTVSSFNDVKTIIEEIQKHGGEAELVHVPDEAADSDPNRKRKQKRGHFYFNYSLLNDSSEQVLYSRLRLHDRDPSEQPALTAERSTAATADVAWPATSLSLPVGLRAVVVPGGGRIVGEVAATVGAAGSEWEPPSTIASGPQWKRPRREVTPRGSVGRAESFQASAGTADGSVDAPAVPVRRGSIARVGQTLAGQVFGGMLGGLGAPPTPVSALATGLAICRGPPLLARPPQAPQLVRSLPLADGSRGGLKCASPDCWYLVHEDPRFGGYCCLKCFHRHQNGSTAKKKKHGYRCGRIEAAANARQADPVMPDMSLVVS